MRLLPVERETIILWSEADEPASVYTYDKKLIAKLKELSAKFPDKIFKKRKDSDGAVYYTVPKACIGIRVPYSDARREAQSKGAQKTKQKPPTQERK